MTTIEAQRDLKGPDVDYALYDADEHYYEPQDCLTRHLDQALQERGQVGRHRRSHHRADPRQAAHRRPQPHLRPGRCARLDGGLLPRREPRCPRAARHRLDAGDPARVPRPRRAHQAPRPAGRRADLADPEPGPRHRGDAAGRSGVGDGDLRGLQPVARRGLGLRPRRAHHHRPDDLADRRGRRRGRGRPRARRSAPAW